MLSLSKHHFFSPGEIDLAMGWPSVVFKENKLYSEHLGLERQFAEVGYHGRRALAGNGMLMPQFAAFFLFGTTRLARKAAFQQLEMPLARASLETEASDDELEDLLIP